MASEAVSLQAGLDALKQEQFSEAIALLRQFCQSCPNPDSNDYWQARIALARAYQRSGDWQRAIALCQQLQVSPNPQVQSWANQALQSLHRATASLPAPTDSPAMATAVPQQTSTLNSSRPFPQPQPIPSSPQAPATKSSQATDPISVEEATRAFKSGSIAIRQKQYGEAIAALEMACRGLNPASREYAQAQMWLVKAYQANGQKERAIAHGQTLTQDANQALQIWAQQWLGSLVAEQVMQAIPLPTQGSQGSQRRQAPSSATTPTGETDSGIQLKSLNELRQFYNNELRADLAKLEARRHTTLQTIQGAGIITVMGVLILSAVLFSFAKTIMGAIGGTGGLLAFGFLYALLLLGGLWAWVAVISSRIESYGQGFKSRIIQKIVRFIDANQVLTYSPFGSSHSTKGAFINSWLFDGIPDHVEEDDCVSGRLGETEIFFSEICAEKLSTLSAVNQGMDETMSWDLRGDSALMGFALNIIVRSLQGVSYILSRLIKGRRIRLDHFKTNIVDGEGDHLIIFKGLFFTADFNKSFKGRTLIFPDVAERLLGTMGQELQAMNKKRGQLIRLEDPEFERFFAVYGTDQVEARYILSTSLMERLTQFRKRAKRDMFISFVNDKIYIAVKYDEDLFEPKLFKSMVDFAPIQEYFDALQLMIGIVEELNLNRRIWTKQ